MDPTDSYSPYAGMNMATGDQNTNLLQTIRSLLANQQQQGQNGAAAPPQAANPAGNAGGANQSSSSSPFSGAGNLIKGLFNPPPTSIVGQIRSGLGLGSGPILGGGSSGASSAQPPGSGYQPMYQPTAGNPMNITPGQSQGATAPPIPLPTPSPVPQSNPAATAPAFGNYPGSVGAMAQALAGSAPGATSFDPTQAMLL